jgi:hypothetical protein
MGPWESAPAAGAERTGAAGSREPIFANKELRHYRAQGHTEPDIGAEWGGSRTTRPALDRRVSPDDDRVACCYSEKTNSIEPGCIFSSPLVPSTNHFGQAPPSPTSIATYCLPLTL